MRNYDQPHPDAIYRDTPTHFIEVYHNKFLRRDIQSHTLISTYTNWMLKETKSNGHKTICLFIIKPKA